VNLWAEDDNQNNHWRSNHEKVAHVDDDSVLPDPCSGIGSCLFLPNSIEQSHIFWLDAVMPSLAFAHDEIYGARTFIS
jgi:hypothetical protein